MYRSAKAVRVKIRATRAICRVAHRDAKARMSATWLVTARTVNYWEGRCVVAANVLVRNSQILCISRAVCVGARVFPHCRSIGAVSSAGLWRLCFGTAPPPETDATFSLGRRKNDLYEFGGNRRTVRIFLRLFFLPCPYCSSFPSVLRFDWAPSAGFSLAAAFLQFKLLHYQSES